MSANPDTSQPHLDPCASRNHLPLPPNNVQRLYNVIHNLANLEIIEENIKSYVNHAQSAVNVLKLLITNDDLKKMIEKLDNVCMIQRRRCVRGGHSGGCY